MMKFKCKHCKMTEKLAAKHYCKVKCESVIVNNDHNWSVIESVGKRLLSWALQLKEKNN
jgi:hypothetical protein